MKKFLKTVLFTIIGTLFLASSVYAGEKKLTFEWDAYQDLAATHFELHESAFPGGPYSDDTVVIDNIAPTTLITVEYPSTKPDGIATTSYFVLKAVNQDNGQKSDPSNEVSWIYDFAPIETAMNLTATLVSDDITFTWEQGDIGRVKEWKLFYSEISEGPYTELALIEYIGQPGPQFSTTETMTVIEGEKKTFYFVLVTFNSHGVHSPNSNEVSVTIDKSIPSPIYNFRIKVEIVVPE